MTKHFLVSATLGGVLLLTGVGRVSAQTKAATDEDNPTAYTALRLVSKALGRDALDRVVEVAGRDGVPQPFLWKIVLKEGAGSREVDVAGGKITAQRPLERPPSSSAPVRLADLNLDSSGAFDAVDAQARKVKLRYDSLSYVLRVSAESGKPVWTVNLLDKDGSEVGTSRLAANDGSTLSTDGRLANNPLPAGGGGTTAATTTVTRPPVTTSTVTVRETPRPTVRPVKPVVREHSTVSTTTVRTTNVPPVSYPNNAATTTTTQQEIPVATLSDHDVDAEEHTEVSSSSSGEGGGLFTRTGRTLDHTSHTVEHHLRRAGATVQRFFTGGRSGDADQGDERD